ncbi:MAG: universal stress protein [Parvularcula sp.]
MGIGTIVLPATKPDLLDRQFAAARTLASGHPHHIIAIHAIEPPRVTFAGEMSWHTGVLQEAEQALKNAEQALYEHFAALCQREGVTLCDDTDPDETEVAATFIRAEGAPDIEIARRARLADLIILATGDDGLGFAEREIAETALAKSGRPVLLLPEHGIPHLPRKALIAWNGSAEAASAVSMAMPLLKLAGNAHVLTIGDLPASTPAPGQLDLALRRHDIKASHGHLEENKEPVHERLIAEANRVGADMLVMGAYSHSRWREFVLGGVTNALLTQPSLPVVIAQ